jgi:hypothetical protein
MDVTFGALDAFAFVVFAVLIFAGVAIIVSLGKLPGQLARKWGHPYASAVNAAGWLGIATGGLLWPLALIWAFAAPSGSPSSKIEARQTRGAAEPSPIASAAPAPSAPAKPESRP